MLIHFLFTNKLIRKLNWLYKLTEKEHKLKMEELEKAQQEKLKAARKDKGLVLVLTGDGKGKSSSAFGMLLRSLGHEMKTGVVQFIKGKWRTGEQLFCEASSDIKYFSMGQGFTWQTQNKEEDIKRVNACWSEALKLLQDENIEFVLLDEINVVLSFDYLKEEEVLNALKARPENQHVVLTGRGASESLINFSDTASVIESPKHAFDNNIRAQKGIEF